MRIERLLALAWLSTLGCGSAAAPPLASLPAQAKPLLMAIQDDIAEGERTRDQETAYRDQQRRYETFWWYKLASWMVEDALERTYVHDAPVQRTLDLGCGYGTLLAFATTIYGGDGMCVDVIGDFLFPAVRAKYRISFVEGDIERGPLPEGQRFDVILMTEVLEHLNFQPVPTLAKIRTALADGGSFFLSTPDAASGWGRQHEYYRSLDEIPALDPDAEWIDAHIWHYDEAELRQVLEEAGFAIRRLDRAATPWGKQEAHFNVWLTTN